ncbi:MAG: long-chain fatty acid--CoA ligase [Myxococcales bacterium]|nr:long-chain fatty acid--CoA ligase [Myxococcales bacterium]
MADHIIETGPPIPVDHAAAGASTLGEMFARRCAKSATRPAYYEKRAGRWQPTSWRRFYQEAAAVAQGLVELGLEAGQRICILGPTTGRWGTFDMGAQLAGLVSVGIYPHQSVEQLRYIIDHSDARVIFVDGEDEADNVLAAIEGNDKLVAVAPWQAELAAKFAAREPRVVPPSGFAAGAIDDAERDRRLAGRGEETAIFVYTSGTTGPPKAAMISHRNILSMLGQHDEILELRQDDLSFSFLPMAHVAERVLGFYGRIEAGLTACYASSIAAVLGEVGEVKPTLFGSVPRLFEKAYGKIFSELEKASPIKQKIFRWAEDVGRQKTRLWQRGEQVPLLLALQVAVADRLVFSKIRAVFGGRVRQFVTGAAPLAVEILEFFWAAGIPIYEVYGMTEATVLTHCNRPGQVRLGTVGRIVAPLEQRIADDGEILLKGPWVFQGYFKNDEATAAAIIDGWLHTGDIGTLDADGYLKITDRKKHLIITAGGKNLTPATIENAIKNEDPLISQVHAHGDKRPYISALIAPSPIETLEWGAARQLIGGAEVKALSDELVANPSARSDALNAAMAKVVVHPEFGKRIGEAVRRGNGKLARVENVRRFRVLERDFSQEEGELTPTMKVKRRELEHKFAPLFDRIYDEDDFALQA